MAADGGADIPKPPLDELIVWQTLAARRATYDTMMWQTPALGLAAQAFLMTLALGPGASDISRCLAALLSLILSVMVLQLMSKHRHFESMDSRLLESLENSLGFAAAIGMLPHGKPSSRYPDNGMQSAPPVGILQRVSRRAVLASSYRVWMLGQSAFAVMAISIIILVLIGNQSIFGDG